MDKTDSGTKSEHNVGSRDPKIVADRLVAKVMTYDPDADEALLRRALDFAVEHHGSQIRASGDPYYYHPVAVAEILAGMRLDSETVITAVLHDTIEDTEVTKELIEAEFGAQVAQLVEGVTKLTKIEYQSHSHRQAENFRKFLLAMSEDIRVLLVKLADRLHNMRTLHFIPKPEKRQRIAQETMDIFAPLAERIGMQKLKDELQGIAFKELQPDAYDTVVSRLNYLHEADPQIIPRIEKQLRKLFDESGMEAQIAGREKSPHSVWRKMQSKNVSFEQLADIIAFRVLVKDTAECYRALGVVHAAYHTIPERFKDFISTPKANGYRSLHTTVMGPEQQRIEIQIRTQEMHEVAEMGVAAHWAYKQGEDATIEGKRYRWVRELLHILEQAEAPEEFMQNTRLEMYHDQVFCFTPLGDLIVLPSGATPVDFAFAVHTAVGRSCVGAKINGRIMPLRTQLQNGDQVEILQSKSQKPSPAWEHFAITGKALAEIRRSLRENQRGEYVQLGRTILEKALLRDHEKLSEGAIEGILEPLNKKTVEDVFAAVGEGALHRNEVVKRLIPEKQEKKEKLSLLDRLRRRTRKKVDEDASERLSVPIRGLIPGMAIHFAGCCHPLPGEKIVGIVNSGKGVTIHTTDCRELENFVDSPERWIDLAWEEGEQEYNALYIGRLRLVLQHKKGSLGIVANTVAQGEGNIINIRITNRSQDYFEMIVDVEVTDVPHLEKIVGLLRSTGIVSDVQRYKEGQPL